MTASSRARPRSIVRPGSAAAKTCAADRGSESCYVAPEPVTQIDSHFSRENSMASIDKRIRDGHVTWLARWRDPAGRQRKRTFPR